MKCANPPQRTKHLLAVQTHIPLSSFPFQTVPSLNLKEKLGDEISARCVHVLRGGATFDPTDHPTCCHGAALRGPTVVRRARVHAGHGVDSERLAVGLRSARQKQTQEGFSAAALCCTTGRGPGDARFSAPSNRSPVTGSNNKRGGFDHDDASQDVFKNLFYKTLPRLCLKFSR